MLFAFLLWLVPGSGFNLCYMKNRKIYLDAMIPTIIPRTSFIHIEQEIGGGYRYAGESQNTHLKLEQ